MLHFPKCLCELFTPLHSQSQHLIQAISPCCLSFVIFQCPSVTLFFLLSHYYPLSFFFLNKFIYLFIFGCVGSSFLCEGFVQLRRAGATLHRGARASHYHGLSRCGAQAPDVQAQ